MNLRGNFFPLWWPLFRIRLILGQLNQELDFGQVKLRRRIQVQRQNVLCFINDNLLAGRKEVRKISKQITNMRLYIWNRKILEYIFTTNAAPSSPPHQEEKEILFTWKRMREDTRKLAHFFLVWEDTKRKLLIDKVICICYQFQ